MKILSPLNNRASILKRNFNTTIKPIKEWDNININDFDIIFPHTDNQILKVYKNKKFLKKTFLPSENIFLFYFFEINSRVNGLGRKYIKKLAKLSYESLKREQK